MSTQVQLRRDIASNVAAFSGAQGECVIDTTNNRLCVQDGATAGGWPAAKLAEVFGRRAVADANTTATASDVLVAYTSVATTRTVTLPAAASYPAGHELTIQDESGALSSLIQIVIAAAGSDTIAGVASIALGMPFRGVRLRCNGSNEWFLAGDNPGILAQAQHGGALSAGCIEQLVTLSGATTTPTLQIPANVILLAVSNRVVTAITGATSYSCGISGSTSMFGASLGAAAGATNFGMVAPDPIYSATSVIYTAAGGNFTGGQVRMTIHYLNPIIAAS